MFIDEGFGTLDSETLEQALRLLDQLSTNSNTLVGIISHVEELKNRIPQQIVVSKDLNGSSLEVVIKQRRSAYLTARTKQTDRF